MGLRYWMVSYTSFCCNYHMLLPSYYRPQRSCGKVIFSEACVKNSVHGGRVSRPRPRGEVGGLARGGPGPHWGVSRPTQGYPGPGQGGGCPGSGLGVGMVYPSMLWGRHPQQTATAAGGTHPTGMHFLFQLCSFTSIIIKVFGLDSETAIRALILIGPLHRHKCSLNYLIVS